MQARCRKVVLIMTQEELKKISKIQLEMIDEIHRICIENNIRYYMAYGTLLGAVRHKGFIPWDLDIDLVMPRADYERFKLVCKTRLDAQYIYMDRESFRSYVRPHALVVHKKSRLTYKYDCVNPKLVDLGVYIDIFPLDNVPEEREEQLRHEKRLKRIRKLKDKRLMYCYSFKRWRRLLHYGCAVLLSWIPVSWLNEYQQKEMQKYNGEETKFVCSMAGGYAYEKECMPREIFSDTVLLEFEGRSLFAPGKYTEYLTKLYGDYMQLPPEEKRQANLECYSSFEYL